MAKTLFVEKNEVFAQKDLPEREMRKMKKMTKIDEFGRNLSGFGFGVGGEIVWR